MVILNPILIPFVLKCKRVRLGTLVQEDNAPAHSSHYQQEVFDAAHVSRLIWPANSPDLNMIEPCWYWMKRETTKQGAFTSAVALKAAWLKLWKEMPQRRIQEWIKRIPIHIKEVIRLKGGNEYKEGRKKRQIRNRVY
jgi:transposase